MWSIDKNKQDKKVSHNKDIVNCETLGQWLSPTLPENHQFGSSRATYESCSKNRKLYIQIYIMLHARGDIHTHVAMLSIYIKLRGVGV